jgi:hypothetical protein
VSCIPIFEFHKTAFSIQRIRLQACYKQVFHFYFLRTIINMENARKVLNVVNGPEVSSAMELSGGSRISVSMEDVCPDGSAPPTVVIYAGGIYRFDKPAPGNSRLHYRRFANVADADLAGIDKL